MKYVYVIMWGEYSDTSFSRVFSSFKRAKDYVNSRNRKNSYQPESYEIVKAELNTDKTDWIDREKYIVKTEH